MPEPFKNMLNEDVIINMGDHIGKAWTEFDQNGFVVNATENLEFLELKQRSTRITETLHDFLPEDFQHAASIILQSLAPAKGYKIDLHESKEGIIGWAIMPLVDYVGINGRDNFDLSMTLFKELTKRSSSEFGIRYFLKEDPERTLSTLETWLDDPNHHVRRLISEGTRPRLPWGMRLHSFVEDPTPIMSLLEKLKDDDEEYVRRSVANNLNDIAKDHPDLVADIAYRWLENADKNRERLVKHACRTLVKQGHKKTLKALGYGHPNVELESFKIFTPDVQFGEFVSFEISIKSLSDTNQNLIIDYAIHHRKANGKTSPKVFKWKNINLIPSKVLKAKKNHPIKKITTRTYYAGQHKIEIFINGVSFGIKEFELEL